MGPSNVGLGVFIDVSRAHVDFCVRASATSDRIASLLALLAQARADDYLSPSDASSIRGKLGFIFSSAYYRFGRAALQPFSQREYRDVDFSFSGALREAHNFLAVILPRLRPLDMHLVPDNSAPLSSYIRMLCLSGLCQVLALRGSLRPAYWLCYLVPSH